MSGPGLGRLWVHNERDTEHLMPRLSRAGTVTSKYWWTPEVWDQGATSQCVAYSGVRYLISNPVRNKPISFVELYKDCQDNDEWPGSNYDGTSVRALFKVFKRRGLVDEYKWAFECGPAVDHLLLAGPVVFGTVWSDRMANIPKNNFLDVEPDLSRVQDGHAWCAYGVNKKKRCPDGSLGAVRAMNSWGKSWGEGGRFWVSFKDLDRLVKAEGESCVSDEIKISALTSDIPWVTA
jgi:C1A family cysteine protease